LTAQEYGYIKSNAQFWSHFSTLAEMNKIVISDEERDNIVKTYIQQFTGVDEGFVYAFDEKFPAITPKAKGCDTIA